MPIPTFIFLDGGYTYEVYNIARDSNLGFICSNSVHLGLAKSICTGVDKIFEEFDSIIVLEDDLIISDNFIEYMLKKLEYYEDKKDIGSVTGFTYIKSDELYATNRFTCLGWATWKDRWEKFNKNMQPLDSWGEDVPVMLDKSLKGKEDSWAIKFTVYHLLNNLKCINPPQPLVQHTGNSGGIHKVRKQQLNLYNTKISNVEPVFKYPIETKEEIRKQFCKVGKLSLARKTINFLKSL